MTPPTREGTVERFGRPGRARPQSKVDEMASPPADSIPPGLNRRRAASFAAWLGIGHALLVLTSYAMLSFAPSPEAGDDEFVVF